MIRVRQVEEPAGSIFGLANSDSIISDASTRNRIEAAGSESLATPVSGRGHEHEPHVHQEAHSSPVADRASTLEALRIQRDAVREELDNEILEHAETEAELKQALFLIRRLRRLGIETGRTGTVWQAEQATAEAGQTVMTVSEAVTRARADLWEFVALPDGADRDLDRLDTAPKAMVWGNAVWRGLTALADYADDVRTRAYTGGFWRWCEDSGAWPANRKKLAMCESQTVEGSRKWREKRVFKVDRAVDPKGKIYMGAHLKIAEGGGGLAPRIYFHDDTAGRTGRVHVGFAGPHYLVPNTKA